MIYYSNFARTVGSKDKTKRKSKINKHLGRAIGGAVVAGVILLANKKLLKKKTAEPTYYLDIDGSKFLTKREANSSNLGIRKYTLQESFKKDISPAFLDKTPGGYIKRNKEQFNKLSQKKKSASLEEDKYDSILSNLRTDRKKAATVIQSRAKKLREQGLYFKENIFLIDF